MQEAPVKKERSSTYNIYTNKDSLWYFFFLHEKLTNPAEANVNPETARKWKRDMKKTLRRKYPSKRRIVHQIERQVNEMRTAKCTWSTFDENLSDVIQDAVENLTESFKDLEIKEE